MKRKTKWMLTLAFVSLGLGLLLCGVGLAQMGFDFTKLNTEAYVENTYTVTDLFENICIDTDVADVRLLPTEGKECKIVCHETEKVTYAVTVENGTLRIELQDARKWYEHIGIFFFGERSLTVYLPQTELNSLQLTADTADVEVTKDFSFVSAQISTDTGDVSWYASTSKSLSISTDTGDVWVEMPEAGEVTLKTDTGHLRVSSVRCQALHAQSSTGDISFTNVLVSGALTAKCSTGDVRFADTDAATIDVKTSTGDVTGTLRSAKQFDADSSTGDIHVPKTTTGGSCKIRTSTGDIRIQISNP